MFSFNDDQMIEFGRFTVYQSLKEMIDEGDDINNVKFEALVENTKRNIEIKGLKEIMDKIIRESSIDMQFKKGFTVWRICKLKITKFLPKILAKSYQEEDLRRAEIALQYHKGMVRVLKQRCDEGKEELKRLNQKYLI